MFDGHFILCKLYYGIISKWRFSFDVIVIYIYFIIIAVHPHDFKKLALAQILENGHDE